MCLCVCMYVCVCVCVCVCMCVSFLHPSFVSSCQSGASVSMSHIIFSFSECIYMLVVGRHVCMCVGKLPFAGSNICVSMLRLEVNLKHLPGLLSTLCIEAGCHLYIYNFKCYPLSPSPIPRSPTSMKMLPPTHSPPQQPGILLHWGNEPSQDQGLLLLLMPDNAILCYICGWSPGSLHVYSLHMVV